jgi:photosynthetic reaction center H subunit
MYNHEFFGAFDIASLVLTLFVFFFIALIFYIRREDRREGYPIEDDVTGRLEPAQGMFFAPKPKFFNLGGSPLSKPDNARDTHEVGLARRSRVDGTPYQPVGDPMTAGVGPGAYAIRAQVPDLTDHGQIKITPLRAAPDFAVDTRDPDPRGMTVLGADRKPAGVVSDVWVDRGEILIRYLEVELAAAASATGAAPLHARRVLLPMTMAVISRGTRTVKVDAVLAHQFAGVPALSNPDAVTRDEEERIAAYYGAGYLYAKPSRLEPLL